ncbi:MAG TPA: hypothetical protein VEZ90_06185 [Blastocatellia bacterium]|nr:hypothetical protein [Blastocatellia bacterium]
MTWSQIKKAVEEAGITEDDEIIDIHCQLHGGDKTLHKMQLGNFVKLAEDESKSARQEAFACSC